MKPIPARLHIIIGLILFIFGLIFDFLFVQGKIGSELIKSNPPILNSWAKMLYELTKFYIIALGLLNIGIGLLILNLKELPSLDWAVLGLLFLGTVILIVSGIWYAIAGPSYSWELRCTTLSIGLFGITASLGLEIYKIIFFF